MAVLGASQLGYLEAVETQQKADLIAASGGALDYIGGVPAAIVPDCLKSAVTKADPYEPDLNRAYAAFARHYGMVVLPARSRKPKDKALVEQTVRLMYQRVYAKLRDRTFYSIDELNAAIGRWSMRTTPRVSNGCPTHGVSCSIGSSGTPCSRCPRSASS